MLKKTCLRIALILLQFSLCAFSQERNLPKVKIFAGAELHYRDLFYTKMYEVLVNLTPGMKWHIGNRWQLAGRTSCVYQKSEYRTPIIQIVVVKILCRMITPRTSMTSIYWNTYHIMKL